MSDSNAIDPAAFEAMDSETLRRILNLNSPNVPADRGNARSELVKRGIVVHTATFSHGDRDQYLRRHITRKDRRFETLCGLQWFGKCSSSSYEEWNTSDCGDCKRAFLSN